MKNRKMLGETLARRLWPLEAGTLRAEACRRTRLAEFGEPTLEPALTVLTASLEHEADLHPLGRLLMRAHLRDLLMARLRLVAEWNRQGETMDDLRIERPLFITGMPRSGSTFLQELLAQDPAHRVPRVWEVMHPLPAPDGSHSPRIRRAAACLWWFRRFAPRVDSVHPIRATSPQECVAIHSYTLLSEEFLTTCHVPGYEAFLRGAQLGPAYAWQRRFLQHLQSRQPARRWVLKSPDHVYGLEALFSVFPDAVIVQTHRNPLDVLKSSIRLAEVLHGVFARPRDRAQLGLRETRVLADVVERFLRFREAHPELAGRFVDVKYSELAADPLGIVQRVYRHLDLPLTDTAADRMRRLIALRSRYPKPRIGRTLADLGIDLRVGRERFKRYCFRFGIPWGQPGTG